MLKLTPNVLNDPLVHNAFAFAIIFTLEIICLGYIREFNKKTIPWWMWLLLITVSLGLQIMGRYLTQQLTGYSQWLLIHKQEINDSLNLNLSFVGNYIKKGLDTQKGLFLGLV
jgi:hypothetical protein